MPSVCAISNICLGVTERAISRSVIQCLSSFQRCSLKRGYTMALARLNTSDTVTTSATRYCLQPNVTWRELGRRGSAERRLRKMEGRLGAEVRQEKKRLIENEFGWIKRLAVFLHHIMKMWTCRKTGAPDKSHDITALDPDRKSVV